MQTYVLGIESSCDECSASIVLHDHDRHTSRIKVLSLATYSQVALHQPYGGVVPEVASRNHLESIHPMIDEALRQSGKSLGDLSALAVTNRPGLVGALLVGVSTAKAMAYALQKPLVPVHHLEGHIASVFLDVDESQVAAEFPMLVAVVSGGHTNLYVMKTFPELWPIDFLKKSCVARSRDDAAGEAFDKIAKILGFPYPGGAWIDKTAREGKEDAFKFPRALPQKSVLEFSFSGLKTAAALQAEQLRKTGEFDARLPDFCASVQEAIVDALMSKVEVAIRQFGCQSLAIVGGVSANSRLREKLAASWKSLGLHAPPLFPPLQYATDNAAMIAAAGAYRLRQGHGLHGEAMLTLNALANPEL